MPVTPEPVLPVAAHLPGHYRIAVVCLGNICRSPMAEVVLTERLADAGLADRVTITSSGTGDWHVGNPMDRRAAATLTTAGYDASKHRAQQWDGADGADLVLTMDGQNLADVVATGSTLERSRVMLFREFDPLGRGDDVPDPYYGGDSGFEEVLAMIERTAREIVVALETQRPWGEPAS